MENIWFGSWDSIIRIICVTPVAYIATVFFLRVSGKRTLAKMNAFDFVITIALGSVLAGVALNQNFPLADGLTVILMFIGLQLLFTWLSVRVKKIKTLITSQPSLIFYKGNFQFQTMKKERITVEEIHSAARQKGHSSLMGVDMIILETTGDIAIIKKVTNRKESTLQDVEINLL